MSTTRPTARDGFVRGGQPGSLLARGSLILLAALGLLALVVLVQFGENGIFAFWDLKTREAELQAEVAGLEAGNQRLAEQLEALADDPEVLERLAREQHNMRRPEEEVLQVVPAEIER